MVALYLQEVRLHFVFGQVRKGQRPLLGQDLNRPVSSLTPLSLKPRLLHKELDCLADLCLAELTQGGECFQNPLRDAEILR